MTEAAVDSNQGSGEADQSSYQGEKDRLQALSDRQIGVLSTLHNLMHQDDPYSFWRGKATVTGLWNLVLLDHELSTRLPDGRLQEPAARLRSALPFTEAELTGLADHMKVLEVPRAPEYAERWVVAANPDDMVLLDRWHQWLGFHFDKDVGDATNVGHELVASLEAMDPTLNDIL